MKYLKLNVTQATCGFVAPNSAQINGKDYKMREQLGSTWSVKQNMFSFSSIQECVVHFAKGREDSLESKSGAQVRLNLHRPK